MTKKLFAIAGLIVLAVALGYLKTGMNSTAIDPNAPKPPPPAAKPAPPKPAAAPVPGTVSPVLPAESVVGSPTTAKYVVVLGWQYDPSNQPNSAALNSAIDAASEAAKSSNGRIAAIIGDVDVPVQDRSATAAAVQTAGLTIIPKGQPGAKPIVVTGTPGEGALTAAQVAAAIAANTK